MWLGSIPPLAVYYGDVTSREKGDNHGWKRIIAAEEQMIRCELTRNPRVWTRNKKRTCVRPGPVVVHEPFHVSLTSFPTRRSNYAYKKKGQKSWKERKLYTRCTCGSVLKSDFVVSFFKVTDRRFVQSASESSLSERPGLLTSWRWEINQQINGMSHPVCWVNDTGCLKK